jgi:transcriptional regulator with XRE-family HTH domain
VATRSVKRPKADLAKENRVIGTRLRAAREAAHLSQRQVALALGENQSWVSKIEKAERRADLAEGTRLMRLYRVEPNVILMPEGLPRAAAQPPHGIGLAADATRSNRRRGGKTHRPKYRGPAARSKPRRED